MINTAPQGSNSVNGREKYFKIITFKAPVDQLSHRPVVCGLHFCAGGSWVAGSNLGGAASNFFFSILPSACFYPLACFCLFSLLTPFSFARFFRQRISRVSMGWWHLQFSAKILALLRLSFNFLQLRLTKKLKINFFVSKS